MSVRFGGTAAFVTYDVQKVLVEQPFEQPHTSSGIVGEGMDFSAQPSQQRYMVAIGLIELPFERCAEALGIGWTGTLGRNCQKQFAAPDNRRHNKVAQGGIVHHIDQQATPPGLACNPPVQRLVVGRHENQPHPFEVWSAIRTLPEGYATLLRKPFEGRGRLNGNDGDLSVVGQQGSNLAQPNRTPTNHQARQVGDVEANWIVSRHSQRCNIRRYDSLTSIL
jgi:hypothetical protein